MAEVAGIRTPIHTTHLWPELIERLGPAAPTADTVRRSGGSGPRSCVRSGDRLASRREQRPVTDCGRRQGIRSSGRGRWLRDRRDVGIGTRDGAGSESGHAAAPGRGYLPWTLFTGILANQPRRDNRFRRKTLDAISQPLSHLVYAIRVLCSLWPGWLFQRLGNAMPLQFS